MTTPWAALGALCTLLAGCPQPQGVDAGSDPADAGDANIDAGAVVDAGPHDAGSSEGEGEGEWCVDLSYWGGQLDDAGVVHYEACASAAELFGSCNDGSCAASDPQRELLSLILDVAQVRGYRDRIEIVQVYDDPPAYAYGDVAVVTDWVRARLHVTGYLDAAGHVTRESVEEALPLYVPLTLPSIDEMQARLRTCASDLVISFCHMVVCPQAYSCNASLGGFGGHGTDHCIGADLNLWDPTVLDSGPSEVTCYQNDLPCCP